MKICFECSEYPPGPHGGIGSLIQILARGLVQAGHEAYVVGTYEKSYPAPDYEEDRGVKVWRLRLPHGRLGWVAGRWYLYRLVKRLITTERIDLVEVPDFGAAAAGWPRLPVPVITRLSGSESYFRSEMGRPPHWTTFQLERRSLHRSNFLCSESRYIAGKTRELFRLGDRSETVIYNPVEVPVAPDERLRVHHHVIFAGTLTKKKGIISLVDSWPAVIAKHPEAELHVWGKDGQAETGESMRQYLEQRIPQELKGSVFFHGHVTLPELLSAFQKAGIVVLPSYAEGFALTPLHAMAAACPTVYSSRGSGPELIDDLKTGLLVDPDRPAEIAAAILKLLEDPALARQLGSNARTTVQQRFSWNTLLKENEVFYQRCLEQFGKSESN